MRQVPLDALRGSIMILMALDHASIFIAREHPLPEMWAGPFPVYTDALPFVTRWVTHFAAPGFFFLMGCGMTLFSASRRGIGWTQGAVVRHLIMRGLLLIGLQFLLENQAWSLGGSGPSSVYFGVLYGLGTTMLAGSLLLGLDSIALIAVSLAAIGTTQFLAMVWNGTVPLAARLLFLPGSSGGVIVYYPTLAWLGLVTFGMVFGHWLLYAEDRTYRNGGLMGVGALGLFLLLRLLDGFGNIRPPIGNDWISYLNVVKYPPSLVFILLTIGSDLVLLSLFAKVLQRFLWILWPLPILGSTSLFFYFAHLYLYALIGLTIGPNGVGIAAMYPYWLLGLVLLIPLCFLYGTFKNDQPATSPLRYF